MALSVQFRDQTDVINELMYRVPVDAADGSQYKTMTEEELLNEKANMRAMRYGFEHSELYAQTDGEGHAIKDENGDYIFDIEKMRDSVDWPIYSSLVDIVLSYPDEEGENEAINHIVFIEPEPEEENLEENEESEESEESEEESGGELVEGYRYDFSPEYKAEHPNARLGQIDIALLNRWIIDGHYVDEFMTDEERAKRTNVKNLKEFFDDYLFDFETYGYLYGLEELQNFDKSYYGTVSALKDTGYNEADDTVYDQQTYDKYLKYSAALESVQAEIAVRQAEVDEANEDLDGIIAEMDEIKELVSIRNWIGTIEVDGNEVEVSFTEDELTLLDKYYLHTDYINQDIFTTSISTNQQIVDTEYQLYLNAMEELYVESHPQYTWTTTQDNLLLMPEFHDWHGDLHVGNFVRISFRDDYQVKLRVSSITLNPLMLEPTIDLQFTSMTNYKSKRNDFTAILDQANSSTKNSITSSLSKKSGTDNQINVDSALILKLLNSSTFANYMGSNNANITNGMSGTISSIATGIVNAMDINVGRITGTSAEFEELFSNYISANFITTKLLHADQADFGELTAQIITVGGTQITEELIQTANLSAEQITSGIINTNRIDVNDIITIGTNSITTIAEGVITTAEISADQITSGTINTNRINVNDVITIGTNSITTIAEGVISTAEISASQITSGTISTDRINVNDVITIGTNAITTIAEGTITTENVVAAMVDAEVGDFDSLTSGSAFIEYLNSGLIEAGIVSAETVIAALVEADQGDFDELTANSAFIQYLNSGLIEAGIVSAETIVAGLSDVTQAQIGVFDLLAGTAFIDYLESNMVVAEAAHITDLAADIADIRSLTAGSAFVEYLQTLSSTAATSIIDDAYIYNAVAGKISVGVLTAGDITLSNNMRIVSNNGQMVMNGTSLQIMGYDTNNDPYVGIQLGYDTNQNPSLILRNEDGATILTPSGITSDAVADGLIVNNMIGNSTIQKGKLAFDVIEPNAQGGIDITSVYDGSGNLWGVQYTSFKQGTEQALSDLSDEIDATSYYLYIETPNGKNIRGGNITLNAKLYKNGVDVTSNFNASCFTWTRHSLDSYGDEYWNEQHATGTKTLTLTGSDVQIEADFECCFESNGVTVTSNNGGD